VSRANCGFASMSAQRRKEVARRGGVAAHLKGTAHKWTPDEARQASLKGRRQSALNDSRRRSERAPEPRVSPMNLDAERPSPWLESLRKNLEDLFASQKRAATNPRSVDHFAVWDLVFDFEVRDLEGAHLVDDARQASLGITLACQPQPLSCRPQRTQNLRPVETLPLTVIAKGHPLSLAPLRGVESP
jgi:hypothetical protein